jgi:hypothetical protein
VNERQVARSRSSVAMGVAEQYSGPKRRDVALSCSLPERVPRLPLLTHPNISRVARTGLRIHPIQYTGSLFSPLL